MNTKTERCTVRYVNCFGFITIPFMALTAFILITTIMVATKRACALIDEP